MSAVIYHRRTEAAKRILWGAMILIGIMLLVLLYSFKTMAQSARKDVRRLEAQIQTEVDAIQLLRAEIVFIERPDRLVDIGTQSLGLEAARYTPENQLTMIRSIPLRQDISEGGQP